MKRRYFFTILIFILFTMIVISGIYMFKLKERYQVLAENEYNEAFVGLVNYINNIENFLAKLQISKSNKSATDNLVMIWREASLAALNVSKLPNSEDDLENISRFLNQLSDYSYSLSKKTIDGKDLTDEDLEKIRDIHIMSKNIEESLNQINEEINNGTIRWDDFGKESTEYAQSVDSFDFYSNLDTNIKEYEGLIYDGAYSDHVSKADKKGLIGKEISEDEALGKIRGFFKERTIDNINSNGLIENVDIPYYNFDIRFYGDSRKINISVSKKGGHIIEFNSNANVKNTNLSIEDAKQKAKEFLDTHGFESMKETYYMNSNNILTINYAYSDLGIVCYPDLVKVKVSLEDGSILGIEALGYLNSHHKREFVQKKISLAEARESLNPKIELIYEGEAVIPTEWKTEIYVYEFKGKIDNLEFLMYVNVETGKEEDILLILETEGGILVV